jgi:hypothetical protein
MAGNGQMRASEGMKGPVRQYRGLIISIERAERVFLPTHTPPSIFLLSPPLPLSSPLSPSGVEMSDVKTTRRTLKTLANQGSAPLSPTDRSADQAKTGFHRRPEAAVARIYGPSGRGERSGSARAGVKHKLNYDLL